MSRLAQRQRVLLHTLKGRGIADADQAESRRLQRRQRCLAMLRETMLWWRQLGLAGSCPLSAGVLKHHGRWPEVVAAFVRDVPGSAYVGEQADRFLDFLIAREKGLIGVVAETERAMRATLADPGYRAGFLWPCDPEPVLNHCLKGTAIDMPHRKERYLVHVGQTGPCSIKWKPLLMH